MWGVKCTLYVISRFYGWLLLGFSFKGAELMGRGSTWETAAPGTLDIGPAFLEVTAGNLLHAICTCRMNNGAGGGARGICVDYLSSEPHQDRKEGPRPGFVLSRFHCSQLLLLQRDARCKIRFSFLFSFFL